MNIEITSDISETISLYVSPNGMKITIGQVDQEITMSIDQAAKFAVEVLTHVDKMAELHLGDSSPQFIHERK